MKAGFISLGCAKNLVDTEVMLGIMREHGIEITNEPAEADILIVNTCAFIQSAKEESITTVLGMADYKEVGRCRSLIVAASGNVTGNSSLMKFRKPMPLSGQEHGAVSWRLFRRH